MGDRHISTKSLTLSSPGVDLASIYKHVELLTEITPCTKNSIPTDCVVVKFLASSINPIDMAVLHGSYPIRPRNHSKNPLGEDSEDVGYDGVAEVIVTGNSVKSLIPSDHVIPRVQGLGTWRTHAQFAEKDLIKIPHSSSYEVDIKFASTIMTSVAPAYFLLEDMRKLHPGDWVVVNAGTSAIAVYLSHFAKLRGSIQYRSSVVVR